jgi:Putative Ig domain
VNGTVASSYAPITFTASNGNAGATFSQWSVSSGSLPAGLTLAQASSSTATLSGTPTMPGNYSFTLRTVDSNDCAGTTSFGPITISCPTLNFVVANLDNAVVGSAHNAGILATGLSGAWTYAITAGALPDGLSIDASNGDITGVPTSTAAAMFTVTATHTSSTCAVSDNFTITPTCPAISVTPVASPLAAGMINVAYTGPTFSAATSATGARTWSYSIGSGALPAGIMINASTGALSGTPTEHGLFSFAVRGTDQYGCLGQTTDISLRICPVITVTPSIVGPLALTRSEAMSTLTFTAMDGAAPYTYTLTGTLPAGLTFTNGVITGTPTDVESRTVTVTATDANGCAGTSASYLIHVDCPAIPITPSVVGPFTQYEAITAVTMSATNTSGTVTWAALNLPTGLVIDSATGTISGTPTVNPGTYSNVEVSLVDGDDCPASPPALWPMAPWAPTTLRSHSPRPPLAPQCLRKPMFGRSAQPCPRA